MLSQGQIKKSQAGLALLFPCRKYPLLFLGHKSNVQMVRKSWGSPALPSAMTTPGTQHKLEGRVTWVVLGICSFAPLEVMALWAF